MTKPPAPPPAAQTCPDCSGSGVGGTRRHGPEPEQWEALRCERCDGEGRIAPPAAQPREAGHYHVRGDAFLIGDHWQVARWCDGRWSFPGDDNDWLDSDLAEIGPRIPTPAERPGDAALQAAISWAMAAIADDGSAGCEVLGRNQKERLRTLVNAYRAGALSPAPRDGGWNAAIEAAAQWHTRMARTAARGTGNTARHEWYAEQIRALARPLPAPPTEDGR